MDFNKINIHLFYFISNYMNLLGINSIIKFIKYNRDNK